MQYFRRNYETLLLMRMLYLIILIMFPVSLHFIQKFDYYSIPMYQLTQTKE